MTLHEAREEESLERWVHIQKNAFTNWCNDKLRSRGVKVTDVKHDFRSVAGHEGKWRWLSGPNFVFQNFVLSAT